MIKCTSCGHENSNYSIYCQSCGAVLSSLETTPDAPASSKPSQPEQRVYVPAEPTVKLAGPETPAEPEEAPVPDKVEGFRYVPPEKDQKGSYTLDTSSPSATAKPEDPNDPFCLWGFISTGAALITCGYAAPLSLALCIVGLVRVSASGKDGKTIAIVGAVVSAGLLAFRVIDFFM